MSSGIHRMVAAAAVLVVVIMIFFPSAGNSVSISHEGLKNITIACSATRFENVCRRFALSSPGVAIAAQEPASFLKLTMLLALQEVNSSIATANQLRYGSALRRMVVEDVRELLRTSLDLLERSVNQNLDANTTIETVRHWLSAALTYNNDCFEYLSGFNSVAANAIRDTAIPLISNSLWALDAFVRSKSSFSPWKSSPAGGRRRKFFEDLDLSMRGKEFSYELDDAVASAVVSLDPAYGSFTSIQAAVDAAPDHLTHRYIIYIRAGIYDEIVRVPSTKTMLVFLGDGINQTVITGNLSTAMNISTYRTATVAVSGNGFTMRDITVVNTAGPIGQAVAMRVDSDMAAFHRCSFWGFQDTLYTHAYRQFYRDCYIYGTIDFIFGNAASVFQNCNIQIRPGGENHTVSTISAHGRTDPAQDSAFVCQSCWVTGSPEYMEAYRSDPRRHTAYLGRPWKPFARAIFMESFLDSVIDPDGWLAWNGSVGLDTVVMAEFRNYGPGASTVNRVSWSKQLTTLGALEYSVRGLIQGGYWLPFTGIPFRLIF